MGCTNRKIATVSHLHFLNARIALWHIQNVVLTVYKAFIIRKKCLHCCNNFKSSFLILNPPYAPPPLFGPLVCWMTINGLLGRGIIGPPLTVAGLDTDEACFF